MLPPMWPFGGFLPGTSLHTSRAPAAPMMRVLLLVQRNNFTRACFQWIAALACNQRARIPGERAEVGKEQRWL